MVAKIMVISTGLLLSVTAGCTTKLTENPKPETLHMDEAQNYTEFARWDFDTADNVEGWSVPRELTGAVMGGSMWLTINRGDPDLSKVSPAQQIYPPTRQFELASPMGLDIPAEKVTKIRMRIRNLSPETDGFVFWRTKENPNGGVARYTMRPDEKEWQDIVCHIDGGWSGTIEQIRVKPASLWCRGDIWIDRIAITDGAAKVPHPRPDIKSENVVPKVTLPGITQEDFQEAFNVLDECLISNVPVCGFNYPFLAPGGAYGECWWQLDSSLNIAGPKWADPTLAENVMRGFIEVQQQNPDGRIDLWGYQHTRGQPSVVSSIPRFFEGAYDVARRTNDKQLRRDIYGSMKKYLGFWQSPVKSNEETGLVTGLFEEMLGEHSMAPGTVAAVDLNMAVAVGLYNTARLAEALGENEDAQFYNAKFENLKQAINKYLWNEEAGVYYNYGVVEGKQRPRLICSTFDTLRVGVASEEKIARLLPVLTDQDIFNWDVRGVTSIAKTEPDYVEASGTYDGTAWFGDIWTMRNMPVIQGLKEVGRYDLASKLTWDTIKSFNANYCEYVVPATGSGEGVQRYSWSASQYVQSVIEYLFGIDYDNIENRLRICPLVPEELFGKEISIENLILPTGTDTRLNLKILQSSPGKARITVELTGELPGGDLEILLPRSEDNPVSVTDEKGKSLKLVDDFEGLKNVAGVRIKIAQSITVTFE